MRQVPYLIVDFLAKFYIKSFKSFSRILTELISISYLSQIFI